MLRVTFWWAVSFSAKNRNKNVTSDNNGTVSTEKKNGKTLEHASGSIEPNPGRILLKTLSSLRNLVPRGGTNGSTRCFKSDVDMPLGGAIRVARTPKAARSVG